MKEHSRQSMKHLLQMLTAALEKENTTWKPVSYRIHKEQDAAIGGVQRDETVTWLVKLNSQYDFNPETLALSIALLDRFLQTVKARTKYLQCIAVACFYIAAKTLEEDEDIPETLILIQESQCGCTVSEVLRMERCILDKLNWDIKTVTALDFLQVFHALLLSSYPTLLDQFSYMTANKQLQMLTYKLQCCLQHHPIMTFKVSTIALALISLELEMFMPDWLSLTFFMQNIIDADNQSIIRCREIISRHLISLRRGHGPSRNRSKKRKVEQLDDDDIYDGIKRLYNEDTSEVAQGAPITMTPCGQEARHDSANPPIQALVN